MYVGVCVYYTNGRRTFVAVFNSDSEPQLRNTQMNSLRGVRCKACQLMCVCPVYIACAGREKRYMDGLITSVASYENSRGCILPRLLQKKSNICNLSTKRKCCEMYVRNYCMTSSC